MLWFLNLMDSNLKSSGLKLIHQKMSMESYKQLFHSTSFVATNKVSKPTFTELRKHSTTQTNKCFLESPRMSPDSLSPKTEYRTNSDVDLLDGSINMKEGRCILRYLHKPNETPKRLELSESSLTKVFLGKATNRISPKVTRSNFLQQTSPLNKIIDDGNFKSRSHAILLATDVKPKKISPQTVVGDKRIQLTSNLHKQSAAIMKNHSFMSPTFSSKQKNTLKDMPDLSQMISPRRGRSVSPKSSPAACSKTSQTVDSSICEGLQLNLNSPKTDITTSRIDAHSEHELTQAIVKLKDVDWNVSLRGLAEIVELCRTIDSNIAYSHMALINQRTIHMLKSSRSHVCRTTCRAVGHLFEYVKDTRRPEFDEIVDTLLCRTADSNKFIRNDANMALDRMVTHIPVLHAIRSICSKGPDHKNFLVRVAAARLVICSVIIAGPTSILNPNNSEYTRRRLILNMVKFVNDKSSEVRKHGERLFTLFCCDRLFEIYLKRYLEKETVEQLKPFLKKHQKIM